MKNLEKIIRERLSWNKNIDESQIEILMSNGVATLKGCVSTYPEKILAEIEVQLMPEIKSVVNDIETIFTDSNNVPPDQEINRAIFCLLDANSEIKTNNVEVYVNDGNVILKGIVNSYWKSVKIRNMASQISGVVSVTNNISIVPNDKMSDGEIANIIVVLLEDCVHVDASKINVRVKDGIVTLSGILSSMSEYKATKDIVTSTRGVLGIIDDLKWILTYFTT